MNGSSNGAKMLAYLRGEKDLFEERKRIAEIKRELRKTRLGYWLSYVEKQRVKRFWQIVSLLEEDARMSLTEMSKRLNIPLSTLFDCMKEVEKFFRFTIVLKDDERRIFTRNAPVTFEFAYEISEKVENVKELPLSVYAEQRG